jgi:hypothetical protein
VRKVLQRLKEIKINLKLKKCEFAVQETDYLGHLQLVNGETTKMQYEKLKSILEYCQPPRTARISRNFEEWQDTTGSTSTKRMDMR